MGRVVIEDLGKQAYIFDGRIRALVGVENERMPEPLDTDFGDDILKAVKKHGGQYQLTFSDGSCFDIEVKDCAKTGLIPKAGMNIRTFPSPYWGAYIRGVIIDGHVVFYRTIVKQEEKHKEWVDNYHKELKEKFKKNRAKLDADYVSLPSEFQNRIDKLRRNNPDFRWKYEEYEMSCCVDAVKIAKSLKTVEAIQHFASLADSKEQDRLVLDLFKGHSGNSFGMACLLARAYIEKPEYVSRIHGALSPLVGSNEYGDVPKVKDKR